MEKIVGRRQMTGDDGRLYDVVELEEFMPVDTKDGREYVPGMRRLQLANGRAIIMLNNQLTVDGTNTHLFELD